jgi:hypothetical protein
MRKWFGFVFAAMLPLATIANVLIDRINPSPSFVQPAISAAVAQSEYQNGVLLHCRDWRKPKRPGHIASTTKPRRWNGVGERDRWTQEY